MEALNEITIDENNDTYPNLYYSSELEDTFIYILTRIPLWSNVMVEKFNSKKYSASSGGSESAFKGFKYDYGKKM